MAERLQARTFREQELLSRTDLPPVVTTPPLAVRPEKKGSGRLQPQTTFNAYYTCTHLCGNIFSILSEWNDTALEQ